MAMTEEEIKGYVLRRLGAGIVDVELTLDHMEDVIRDSKRWFGHRVGQKRMIQVPLLTSSNVYVMDPDVTDVLRVHLPSSHFPAVDTDDFSSTYSMMFGQWRNPGQSPLPYSDLLQRMQYLNVSRKLFSADREWDYDPRTRELQIMPRPSIVGNMLVEVWTSNLDTREFGPEDESLFLRYALAHAKTFLGEIRSKYDNMPMVGGDKGLNGQNLMDEAKEEKEQIEKDVINWRRATPILME